MLRTHTCGELNINNLGQTVTLCGWVQKSRDLGGTTFIDVRDRYGLTQLVLNTDSDAALREASRELGREFVIKVDGKVIERTNKNTKIPTGDIEIVVAAIEVLNSSKVPPFMIEDETDGGEELRAKYRYLDLRRNPIRNNLVLRHKMAQEIRKYLDVLNFIEVETPVLIKSTPEGARDFVVPSRMNPGEFYALPQSPQTFKQLLMVSGFDRYFQIVKCFRDEDLRADRQPEFTQIDCEMAFITQEDILNIFEGLTRHLFKAVKGIEFSDFPRMQYADAMRLYGSDKPDIRFGMQFVELNDIVKGKGLGIFDNAELVVGINAKGCADYTRKQIDELTEWLKRPQIGATGMIYCRYNTDGTLKSSVDKFYSEDDLTNWAAAFEAEPGDLILVLAGNADKARKQLNELRLEMGSRLGLRDKNTYAPLWVLDFPLLEWDEETERYHAMHHPFTSPKPEDIALLDTNPGDVRANAYDLVINGTEIGGGSIRIHDRALQALMFKHLGFSTEEAQKQFGFLMDAFEYGAPPHGGIAFGFDRLCSIFAGLDSIRDVIAFPKNNSGRDVMIDSPSILNSDQLDELLIKSMSDSLQKIVKSADNISSKDIFKLASQIANDTSISLEQEKVLTQKLKLRQSDEINLGLRILEKEIIKILGLNMIFPDFNNGILREYDAIDSLKNQTYEIKLRRRANLHLKETILPLLNRVDRVDFIVLAVMNLDYTIDSLFKFSFIKLIDNIHLINEFESVIIDKRISVYEDIIEDITDLYKDKLFSK